MTTALTLFNDGSQLPAHLADWEIADNISAHDQIPQLSFRGKVWRLVLKGEETVITNADQEPAQSVQVVILDYNKKRSRAYYPGAYEEGKSTAPTCWSNDGDTPDASVQDKQSPTCGSCKWAAKGSKVTDSGKAVTACTQYKRMVVVPVTDVNFEPLLVKLPQTSLWDKDNDENEAKRFYAFDQYLDFLKRNGVPHTAKMVTKIKFDSRTAYPKLLFGPIAFLPADLLPGVKAQVDNHEKLDKLLNVAPISGDRESAPAPAEFQPAAAPPAQQAEVVKPEVKAPPKGRPKAKATEAEEAAPAFGGNGKAAAPAAKAPTTDVPPATVAVSSAKPAANPGLATLLAGWDD
jgi:hypothetical protein